DDEADLRARLQRRQRCGCRFKCLPAPGRTASWRTAGPFASRRRKPLRVEANQPLFKIDERVVKAGCKSRRKSTVRRFRNSRLMAPTLLLPPFRNAIVRRLARFAAVALVLLSLGFVSALDLPS